jgi:glycosyltransferase involved in cell wall biosynthesis
MSNFVTFIIPSLGRSHLIKTLESLANQTDSEWECLIGFDGLYPTVSDSEKIKCVKFEKIGNAGKIRNKLIDIVTTPWIAFVDDDDLLKENYIEKLKFYCHEKDVVHFSMLHSWCNKIIPSDKVNKLKNSQFGISFSVKTKFIKSNNIKFSESKAEDIDFLLKCQSANANIFITHDVQYIVPKTSNWKL